MKYVLISTWLLSVGKKYLQLHYDKLFIILALQLY